MGSVYNGLIARDDYEFAKNIFVDQAGFNPDNIRLTSADIRLEQALVASQNSYTFPVLINIQNASQPFPTEVRLQQQDSLCVTQLGIFLAPATSATDATFRLETYANPAVFTNATQLNSLYQNGRLQLTLDNDVWIKQWGLYRHYHVPETQQTTTPGAGSPVDQLDGLEDGFYPMQPFVILKGTQDIQLTINLPLAAPTAVDAFSRIVIIMRGFLAQSSTNIR
jgi:hypothetical protein